MVARISLHSLVSHSREQLFVSILIVASAVLVFPTGVFAIDSSVKVDPGELSVHKTDVFSVNVSVLNISSLWCWEFRLFWNKTILNCTKAETHIPNSWINNTYEVERTEKLMGIQNDFNSTHGRFWRALTALWPAPPFNGSTALVAFTFKALNTGITTLDLQNVTISTVTNNALSTISVGISDGNVTVSPEPLYMRSDQHTVNSATMYKLMENHTQTALSVNSSVTDPENEAYCYWGVRAWKRSSAGTETELTSGSPVSVVSRTSSGSGLQSATWACPGTNLSVTDCLVVRVYYKFDWINYTQCSQFITVQLNATTLAASTWAVYYYTQRSYNTGSHKTYMYYYWDNNYNSRIENVNYY
jgi:hypothetical protein